MKYLETMHARIQTTVAAIFLMLVVVGADDDGCAPKKITTTTTTTTTTQPTTADSSNVRLVDGPTPDCGRAEFWNGTTWGSICDSDFSVNGWPVVFCKELSGFLGVVEAKHAIDLGFPIGTGPITKIQPSCGPSTTSMGKCAEDESLTCGHGEDAGIVCKDIDECATENGNCDQKCINLLGTYSCNCWAGYTLQPDGRTCVKDPNVRLVDGPTADKGRAEYWNGSIWGSICDSDFGTNGWPVVFCKELGGYSGVTVAKHATKLGIPAGTGPITKIQPSCGPSTANMEKCAEDESLTCGHDEDVGISCQDINECDTDNGDCEQQCTNAQGTYSCTCWGGYTMSSNGQTCIEVFQ